MGSRTFLGVVLAVAWLATPSGAASQEADGEPAADWLSARERAWLADHPTLRHGVVRGHEPFEYLDANGNPTGLMSDYVTIVGQRLGIDLQVVPLDGIPELQRALREGRVDLASYLPRAPVWSDQYVWSEPIISMPIAVFGAPDADLLLNVPALAQWRVAMERPSRAWELFSKEWPTLSFVEVASPEAGLEALRDGRVDYFIHNVFSVQFYQRELGIQSLKIALQTPYTFDVHLSTRPQLAPLVPLIDRVVRSLSDHERTLIFDKWVNLRAESGPEWQQALRVGVVTLAVVLLVLGATILWNRRLTREVEERTRDLAESSEAMRALAQHLDRVREEEKSRIAREMHDELGESLTALTMTVRRLRRSLSRDGGDCGDRAQGQLEELLRLTKQASATSRRIMSDLRPSVLEDLGLVAAIEWLAHEFEGRYGIACEVRADDLSVELPEAAPIALFRIVQESLTNIARHSEASQARIDLRVVGDRLWLEVRDDGVGIPPDWSEKGSFGLLGMSERALALGGKLTLPVSSRGGHVRVSIPLRDAASTPESAPAAL